MSFSLREGETLGLVGESGSGKTTTCLSIVGLLPRGARIVGGSVVFEGEDLTRKSQRELRRIRGRRIAVILQDPMASLNPLFTIFRQVAEPAFFHQQLRGRTLRARVQHLLTRRPHPLARVADARVSAPDERRHAPAHRRRHRAGRRPEPRHRRRAHDEPRRHHPGAVPRPPQGHPARDGRGPDLRDPQPGHRRQDVRPGRRDVRGQDRRAGAGARAVRRPQAPVHARPARLGAEARQQGAAVLDPGPAPEPGHPAPGLRLPSALSRGHAALHDRGAGRLPPRRRQRRPVLAPGHDAPWPTRS